MSEHLPIIIILGVTLVVIQLLYREFIFKLRGK